MALAFGAGVMSMLGACASGPGVVVTSIADPDADLASVRTFDLIETPGADALLEKNLLRLAQSELTARGYARDPGDPDVLVAVAGVVASRREYVPPDTTYTPFYDPGDSFTITRRRKVNGQVITYHDRVRTPGDWVYVPRTTPGYERTIYEKTIVIRLLDGGGGDGGGGASDVNAVAVWEGRGVSTSAEPDLLGIAPAMIREVLAEFPAPSGKASRRGLTPDPR